MVSSVIPGFNIEAWNRYNFLDTCLSIFDFSFFMYNKHIGRFPLTLCRRQRYRETFLNGTAGNVIELVDHIHHAPTQNDVFKICNIKKFRFS
jgi:hypothetical protein